MALAKRDREFRLAKVSYVDFKSIEMDRVMTRFFERLEHNGFPSRLRDKRELTVEHFVDELVESSEMFVGFAQQRDVVERWVETHLMDIVNRGKRTQAVAGPRPLHGFTYRFRNPNHSRDYGAAQQLYEMLAHARSGPAAIEHLKAFFFEGFDRVTKKVDEQAIIDIETATLLHFLSQRLDAADTNEKRESYAPLCRGAAELMADDVLRLLFYRRFMPRSVMVEYLKILLAFHLGVYHLRLLKLLPAIYRSHGAGTCCDNGTCALTPGKAMDAASMCPYSIGVLVDLTGRPEAPIARLAERSADGYYRRIAVFTKSYFAAKKLDEFSEHLHRLGKLSIQANKYVTVAGLFALLSPTYSDQRDSFFAQRLAGLMEDISDVDTGVDPEIAAVAGMGLPAFDTYIESLMALRGNFHRKYLTECFDTLLLKNRPGALLAQGRTRNAPRRFTFDSRLLEVLLQIAVLRPGGNQGYHTGDMRIDELLRHLQIRYGIYVDQLPPNEGFSEASIGDRQALRENRSAFIDRLREVGFYRDLSDAYVTQAVIPRYRISAEDTEAA